MTEAVAELRARYRWRPVEAPQRWEHPNIGDELTGYFGGKTLRDGQYGQYHVVIVHVPQAGAYTLSGTGLITLVDASGAVPGSPIVVRWMGYKETAAGHQMKHFELLVADGECLPADALPALPPTFAAQEVDSDAPS